jgi:hypothetical protein
VNREMGSRMPSELAQTIADGLTCLLGDERFSVEVSGSRVRVRAPSREVSIRFFDKFCQIGQRMPKRKVYTLHYDNSAQYSLRKMAEFIRTGEADARWPSPLQGGLPALEP